MIPPANLTKKKMTLWYMEATGTFEKPYRICYHKPYIYVQQYKDDAEADMIHVENICGEAEKCVPISKVKWSSK